ncbi:MAG TPA: diacylglycerol kinase family protein [Streptosporangiaceae bacterium]|nr:diacylglycerol kinase family protein [Streptosporangiaceae bacterium]
MRALLIVNPRATSTTRLRRDVIASALASAVKLEVVETRYRGHATSLASVARTEGFGLVLTLGGDGTINEVVNGLLGPSDPAEAIQAAELPALAALPGGSGNVFTGALGLPRDPVDATGEILQALAVGQTRTIGVGNADGRYFTFNCGVGLDAEVVRAVQGLRAHGRQATPSLYVRLALRQFYRQTDRSKPAVWIEPHDGQVEGPVFLGIVSNTAPWTYLGGREVNANPQARFDAGLDVFALRSMSSASMAYALGQMFATKGGMLHGRNITTLHDQPSLTLRADRPVAFQIDGEYVGERELVRLRSIPSALRVIGLCRV